MKSTGITSVVLGAGFSCHTGFPLTRDLFNTTELPDSISDTARACHDRVARTYQNWVASTGKTDAELWLLGLYKDKHGASEVGFDEAVRFAMARLVDLPPGDWRTMPYMYGITCSVANLVHREFWAGLRRCSNLKHVVTMNYDILAEQGLKEHYSDHRTAPVCHYGGFPAHQFVRKMLDVRKPNIAGQRYEDVELGSEITIYKMHGSINWCDEPHGFKIHDDVRGVFRAGSKHGQLAIVPPIPGKDGPPWLTKVWEYAGNGLRASRTWIVCGYSMPDYDDALREFFREAAAGITSLEIFILDPNSSALLTKWQSITPAGTKITPLKGLPDGLTQVIELITASSKT
jgi:hypothetical protein